MDQTKSKIKFDIQNSFTVCCHNKICVKYINSDNGNIHHHKFKTAKENPENKWCQSSNYRHATKT